MWLKDILDQALCTAPCIFSSSRPVSTLSTQQAQGPRATSTACASRQLLAAWRLQSPSTSSTGSPGPEMCCQGRPVYLTLGHPAKSLILHCTGALTLFKFIATMHLFVCVNSQTLNHFFFYFVKTIPGCLFQE